MSSAETDSELSSVQSILTANLHVFLSGFLSTIVIKKSTDIDNVSLQKISFMPWLLVKLVSDSGPCSGPNCFVGAND